MKRLRNKKTGEIVKDVCSFDTREFKIGIEYENSKGQLERIAYNSLTELNEEWEDYAEPKDPYIGEELERKLVREWASAYAITTIWATRIKNSCLILLTDNDESRRSIVIDSYAEIANGRYSVDELCGKEEE